MYSTLHVLHNLNTECVVPLYNNQRNCDNVTPVVYVLPKMRLASSENRFREVDLVLSPLTATAPLMGLPAPSHKTACIHLSA